ncbi:MAG: cysteine desulfurase [Deltaproteobacteria bacterium]|jgi:cysteine desulfurase/selenocysteine lyase|nr:cysteine desulfurase [Deltaproteobacteria bacterium]
MTSTSLITEAPAPAFDVLSVREDFPALHQEVHGNPLVYLDSAATSLKPQAVIDAVSEVYTRDCANIHRAVHLLSQRATARYEEARDKVQSFLNAAKKTEVVFTRGTTEAINLVAHSFGRSAVREGDEILVTELEHHSNIVPWQILCQQTGAKLVVVPMTDRGEVLREAFEEKLSDRTKLVAIAHVSNALGTVLPAAELIALAHARGAVVILDGAQAVSHVEIDVQALDCDFYAFSGHKLYGPTGIGVLYGKERWLEGMPPYQGGGDMIRSVTFEETIYNELPYKFEAGTPNIAGAIGLGAAIDYYRAFDQTAVHAHERAVLRYATEALESVPGVRLIGTAPGKVAALSFLMDAAHPHDVGTIVDSEGVAIRTGHHCAQPVMEHFGIAATARASLGMYNTTDDIDALVRALEKVRELFA